jgi:5-methyltetrahydrofolate--homocysteine methyltransferase
MLIIGERINTVRPNVAMALKERQAAFFREEVLRQVEAGADMIDVNAGSEVEKEPANMAWLVEVVQSAVDVPLCIDSYNSEAVDVGLKNSRHKEQAIANSITLQRGRYDRVLPLVREYGCSVIGLPIDDAGIPYDVSGRVEKTLRLADVVSSYDIPLERLYIDLLAMAVSTDTRQGPVILETLKQLKMKLPQVQTLLSLTGMSFGLPARRLISCTFLPMLLFLGIDALILDPSTKSGQQLMAMITTADMLLDRDRYCQKFIATYHQGKLRF